MMRRSSRADVARVRHVLAGVTFPAAKWQLIIHAEDYGADATTRSDLWRLAAGVYPDIQAVLAALGMVAPAPREGYRSAPSAQAAGRDNG